MIKLLYITNGVNGAGGLERVLSIKASFLADHYDYDVNILSLNNSQLDPFYTFSSKIKMLSIPVDGNIIQYIKAYTDGLQTTINTVSPDIISVCDDGLKGFFIPTILKTKAKIIYERHVSKLIEANSNQGFIPSLLIKAKWQLMSMQAKRFSKFVLLTEDNKKEWKTLDNIEVISNPLSFSPEDSSLLSSKTVICVGKISYQKGQDLLAQAWRKVWEKHPDWKLELYGYANENFLSTKKLSSINIHYYPPEKEIMKKYLDSSIYVMSSRFEGFGMVLIEAMACGLPCVSFDCNYGPGDIIADGEDGFLVEKENIEALSSKIKVLIENEELRKDMGRKAKKNVRRFAPETIVMQWDKLFKQLLN